MFVKGIIIVFLVALGVMVIYRVIYTGVRINELRFQSTQVSNSTLTLAQGSFASSALWYSGYSTRVSGGELCIFIRASRFKLPQSINDPFTIHIPIDASLRIAYLCDSEGKKMTVWSRG